MEHANESPRGAHTIDEAVALRERAQKYGAAPATVTLAEAELNWLSAGAGTIEEGRALYQLCMALSGEIGTLRAQIFALGTSDSALVESLRDMSEAINGVAPPASISRTDPTVRVRLNHTFSAKDGWRLSETTVEWCGPANALDQEELLGFCATAFNVGQREAGFRNNPQPDADEEPA